MTMTGLTMWRGLRGALFAGLMSLVSVAWAQVTPPLSSQDMAPYWDPQCNCYRNVPWGGERWFETSLNREVSQVYDLWMPPMASETPMPLVIWAHASGSDHVIPNRKGPVYRGLVSPALAAGMAVMSVEFRHPVDNAYLGAVHHDDLLHVIQYARALAPALGLDVNNVFLASRSRGTLAIWTAMQDDRAQPDGSLQQQQSSRVTAVFGIQAQTTYASEENALYLYEEERKAYLKRNPGNPLFGSAVASASADDPPVLMRYTPAFYRRLVHRNELSAHHPDYGLTLCQRYTDLGIGEKCLAQDQVQQAQYFAGVIPFFQAFLKPAR
ncbi:hypothetical protein [Ideonella sp.]|jgi:acetyl esterase/lipase|uniref:hypothetical protein n=1 Tax=Ideonella sp. TaxID=1929293 RepID=UPI0037BFADDE